MTSRREDRSVAAHTWPAPSPQASDELPAGSDMWAVMEHVYTYDPKAQKWELWDVDDPRFVAAGDVDEVLADAVETAQQLEDRWAYGVRWYYGVRGSYHPYLMAWGW